MLIKRGRKNNKADVRQLQEGLAFFGFHPGAADGIFGKKSEDALEDWQAKVKLYPDGVFGDGSNKAWADYCAAKNALRFVFVQTAPAADPTESGDAKLKFVKCPAKSMPNGHGYNRTTLRSDTAVSYKQLHADVVARGGYMTSAGGKRGLSSKASPARSKKSFHYTGRAFDLATYSALGNPETDPFICVRDPNNSRKWIVWCVVKDDEAPLASHVETVTLEATVCKTKRRSNGSKYTQLSTVEWTGKAFNFTEMAAGHGFDNISGRKSFFRGGSYGGSEWWHFQWISGLTRGTTTFGEELLKAYTLAQCKKFVYWDEAKDARYGVSWF